MKNISYKECSPYSGMSISHACIPFPGHSDGKRITMGCNQLSQASPMAHMERPYVNGGGESMLDYGFYRAETILEIFINQALHIMQSSNSTRMLFYQVTLSLFLSTLPTAPCI